MPSGGHDSVVWLQIEILKYQRPKIWQPGGIYIYTKGNHEIDQLNMFLVFASSGQVDSGAKTIISPNTVFGEIINRIMLY